MRRLICAFVVRIGLKQVFSWWGSFDYEHSLPSYTSTSILLILSKCYSTSKYKILLILLSLLVWFLFYGLSTHFRSFRARAVNLATVFLGKPPRQFTSTYARSFASNWQLPILNQRKRENGRRNVFMTKSPRKNVPDVGIALEAACMPREHASDRATVPGILFKSFIFYLPYKFAAAK